MFLSFILVYFDLFLPSPFFLFFLNLGEKVSQGKIRNKGLKYLETEFPNLDYITSCDLIEENIPWIYAYKPTVK